MKKIEIRNKIAIILDHRDLINDIYNNKVNEEEEKFTLRAELFYFHERRYETKSTMYTKDDSASQVVYNMPASKPTKTRKRTSHKPTADSNAEIGKLMELQALCEGLLPVIKLHQRFIKADNDKVTHIPRYWEQITTQDFPQFNGANNTGSYQHCHFGTHSYLIPPQCSFFNYDIAHLPQLLPKLMPTSKRFDLIVLDPPWRNKYIRRLKRARQELGYKLLDIQQLQQMPIKQLVHVHSLVAIWCTNSKQLQEALLNELLPSWHLRLLQTVHWLKFNTSGKLIGPINTSRHQKQPFEMLYLACHADSEPDFGANLQEVAALLSVPSIVHSHKPPLLPWLQEALPAQPNCLEVFARYLQPQFASLGLEVLKLMDERLYALSDEQTT